MSSFKSKIIILLMSILIYLLAAQISMSLILEDKLPLIPVLILSGMICLIILILLFLAIKRIKGSNNKYKKKIISQYKSDLFESLYSDLEAQCLFELKQMKKEYMEKLFFSILLCIAGVALFCFINIVLLEMDKSLGIVSFLLMLMPGGIKLLTISADIYEYKEYYKENIVARYVSLINRNLIYKYKKGESIELAKE